MTTTVITAADPGDPGENVTRSEYRTITVGMTRQQLRRVTGYADSWIAETPCGVTDFYRDWDQEHFRVAVVFDRQQTVRHKASARRGAPLFFACAHRTADASW